MTTRPSAQMRRIVFDRAKGCCEYCLIPESLSATSHQVDHVIAEKHGGGTELANLAVSCTTCNLRKSSDIASLDSETGELVALYNPRDQRWTDNFKFSGATLIGLTPEGRTTIDFLQLNSQERLRERIELMRAGVYPPKLATRKPK